MAALNTEWLNNITAQINSCADCSTLQLLIDQVVATLNAQLAAYERQLTALLPLTTIPTNLSEVIDFITAQIGFYEAQYAQAVAAEAALIVAYTNLITVIVAKINGLHCSITPPTPP